MINNEFSSHFWNLEGIPKMVKVIKTSNDKIASVIDYDNSEIIYAKLTWDGETLLTYEDYQGNWWSKQVYGNVKCPFDLKLLKTIKK